MSSLAFYAAIVSALDARRRCEQRHEECIGKPDEQAHWTEMVAMHQSTLDRLAQALPSGSGIDSGTELCEEKSNARKLTFTLGYHHMSPEGYYVGWSNHTVTVRPDWSGPNVRVVCHEKRLPGGTAWSIRELNDHLAEMFDSLNPRDSPLVERALELLKATRSSDPRVH